MLIALYDARTFSVFHFSEREMPSELAGQFRTDCWGIIFTFSDSLGANLGCGEGVNWQLTHQGIWD